MHIVRKSICKNMKRNKVGRFESIFSMRLRVVLRFINIAGDNKIIEKEKGMLLRKCANSAS